ncbi:MAG: isochorismatase family protein [Pseudomonadota bacterium]
MLIKRNDCCLLVIDVQSRLLPAMYAAEDVASRCRDLLSAAAEFDIPVLVSEHYPQGIGNTAGAIADAVGDADGTVMEKIHFSCFAEPSVRRRIRAAGRGTLILTGIEAHVCLGQTALDLVSAGFRVVVSSDGTGSQTRLDHATALHRLERAGAEVAATAQISDALYDDAPMGSAPTHLERIE